MHGGGMVAGSIDQEEAVARMVATAVPAVVVSVGYRLAPEHPAPAAVHDCYAALVWLAESAADLGVDPRRLAVLGRSAGGGLAAAVALLARDLGGPELRFQMPLYPMLDDRNVTPSSHEIIDVGVWDRAANVEAWELYLAGRRGDDEAVTLAVPARVRDLSGLPPAFVDVGTVDLFRDEVIAYVARLVAAGIPVEFHLWPGVYHAAEKFAPRAAISARIWDVRFAALRAALLN
jgi:acetyl esterase/lipase